MIHGQELPMIFMATVLSLGIPDDFGHNRYSELNRPN
jgi:hypothetical protein